MMYISKLIKFEMLKIIVVFEIKIRYILIEPLFSSTRSSLSPGGNCTPSHSNTHPPPPISRRNYNTHPPPQKKRDIYIYIYYLSLIKIIFFGYLKLVFSLKGRSSKVKMRVLVWVN